MFVPALTCTATEILTYFIKCCQGEICCQGETCCKRETSCQEETCCQGESCCLKKTCCRGENCCQGEPCCQGEICCLGKTCTEWAWKESLSKIIRHLPVVQTFVHFSSFLKLKRARDETAEAIKFYKSLDPDEINGLNIQNCRKQIEKAAEKCREAKKNYMQGVTDFQDMKLYEAFGEAAPQAILQFAVVLQIGYVSPVQVLTIITSLFTFSLASAEVFLMMKTKNNPIKDSTWRETFILVMPAMFLFVVPRILTMSLIAAYTKALFIIFVITLVFFNILMNIKHLRRDPVQVLLGILTNVFVPCIVIDEGSAFYKWSATAASVLHVLCLAVLNALVIAGGIIPCPDFQRKSYPPVLHCYPGKIKVPVKLDFLH